MRAIERSRPKASIFSVKLNHTQENVINQCHKDISHIYRYTRYKINLKYEITFINYMGTIGRAKRISSIFGKNRIMQVKM